MRIILSLGIAPLVVLGPVALAVVSCGDSATRPIRILDDSAILTLESLTIGGATRVGVRLAARERDRLALPLHEVPAGVLSMFVGIVDGSDASGRAVVEFEASSPLRARHLSSACEYSWPSPTPTGGWSECSITIPRPYTHGELRIRLEAGQDAELLVSNPTLVPEDLAPRPNVFVLLLDTARSDTTNLLIESLGSRGLRRLASDSLVFENARSTSSWTRPAVASLFTGLRSTTHRVFGRLDALSDGFTTLPEILQDSGYLTMAWSSNPNILPLWGFGQGFDLFVDVGSGDWATRKTDGRALVDALVTTIMTTGGIPSLYYLHFMDPHSPYEPPQSLLEQVQSLDNLEDSFPSSAKSQPEEWDLFQRYVAEMLDLDQQLERLIDALEAERLYDDAIILVLSDHGEEFLDHGGLLHGRTLFEEMLRVPAMLKLPSEVQTQRTVTDPIELEDLMPTLLRAMGIEISKEIDGRAAIDYQSRPIQSAPRPRVASLRLDGRRQSTVVDGQWKLIVYHNSEREKLFHLAEDPGEQRDRASAMPGRVQQLRGLLGAASAAREAGWHIRACGGAKPGSMVFELLGPWARLEASNLEPGDLVDEHDGERARIALQLNPYWAKREHFGELIDVRVVDEDALRVVERTPSEQRALLARAPVGQVLRYALARDPQIREAAVIDLMAHLERATLEPGSFVECPQPRDSDTEVASHGLDSPYLSLSYVSSARELSEEAVDPGVAERLRALGYSW